MSLEPRLPVPPSRRTRMALCMEVVLSLKTTVSTVLCWEVYLSMYGPAVCVGTELVKKPHPLLLCNIKKVARCTLLRSDSASQVPQHSSYGFSARVQLLVSAIQVSQLHVRMELHKVSRPGQIGIAFVLGGHSLNPICFSDRRRWSCRYES